MKLEPYACFASMEIANAARVTTYGRDCLFNGCDCPALDGIFIDPATDPAPWYDAGHPESANFLGFLPESINLSVASSRSVAALPLGTMVGAEHLSGRVVEVIGWMIARDAHSMYWGQLWLTETLRGSRCLPGCADDTLQLLPFCREQGYPGFADFSSDFRTLVGAGLVDGPRWSNVIDDACECYLIQTAQFQIATSMPWLYQPPIRCYDATPIAGTLSCALTTPEWQEGTYVIDIRNTGTTPTTNIVISGRISLDGSCPVTGLGTSVPASFTYTIPSLGPEDRIVIDGTRREVLYYDASDGFATPGLPYLVFEGPFDFPDVGVCTTMCLSISSSGGAATATVDTFLREL